MFSALARLFRSVGYLFTGRVDDTRRGLDRDPRVIRATYDRIVDEKRARIGQYKDAVARMMTQEETKLAQIRKLSDEVAHLERLKEGAAAKARKLVEQSRTTGKTAEQIKTDPDYLRTMTAFNDFTSTIGEKRSHIGDLEIDVKQITESVGGHKLQLQQLLRELEKLRGEADATVADVITAGEEKQINDMLAGISQDRTGRELEDMRRMRADARSGARASRELAGTDTRRQEAEFLEYARTSVATDEFDRLIGLAGEAETSAAQTP